MFKSHSLVLAFVVHDINQLLVPDLGWLDVRVLETSGRHALGEQSVASAHMGIHGLA